MTATADQAVLPHPELAGVGLLGEQAACEKCGTSGARGSVPHRHLSKLDAMILESIATGASSVQIACRLYLSRQAVDYHIKGMLRQLNAVNRAELVSKACASGVLEVGTWPPRVPLCFIEGEE